MKRIQVLGNAEDLPLGRRKVIVSKRTGRSIVLIRHPTDGRTFYCMDALCYHHGGDLGASGRLMDIEDVGMAIECPEHNHVISLKDGGLVKGGHCAPLNKNTSACKKQRTHQVEVDDQNRVWVIISGGNPVESDKYNIARQPIQRSSTVPSRKRPSVVSRSRNMLQFRSRKLQATEAIMKKLAMKNQGIDEAKVSTGLPFAS